MRKKGDIMKVKDFRELDIWKLGKEIVLDTYQITRDLPEYERFNLREQMQRSAISIPSNIAEGFNRFQNKEFRRFLYIALGSCAELETQMEISGDLQYISKTTQDKIIDKINHESRMITNFIKRINLNLVVVSTSNERRATSDD